MTPKHKPSEQAVRCCFEVSTNGNSFHWHRCSRKATVCRDGKNFCKTHDPDEVKRRRAARTAKFEAAMVVDFWKHEACAACHGMKDPRKKVATLLKIAEAARNYFLALDAKPTFKIIDDRKKHFVKLRALLDQLK